MIKSQITLVLFIFIPTLAMEKIKKSRIPSLKKLAAKTVAEEIYARTIVAPKKGEIPEELFPLIDKRKQSIREQLAERVANESVEFGLKTHKKFSMYCKKQDTYILLYSYKHLTSTEPEIAYLTDEPFTDILKAQQSLQKSSDDFIGLLYRIALAQPKLYKCTQQETKLIQKYENNNVRKYLLSWVETNASSSQIRSFLKKIKPKFQ